MAISAEQQNEVIGLIVGMFDAAPSATLLQEFADAINGGATVASLADSFAGSDEFKSIYPDFLTDSQFATKFTTTILDGNTSASELADAITAVEALLVSNSRGATVNIAVDYLLNTAGTSDPIYGTAVQALENKIDVATYFATTQLDAASDLASLQAVVANVTSDATTVTNQKILIDANLDSGMQSLTTGQDNLTGSAGNDGFTAWIFDNQNTAQSGDMINGGAGTDTLLAEIGDSANFAISLKTESVEVAQFRVQDDAGAGGGENDPENAAAGHNVQIDAQDMNGTVEFWGVDQRASLVIEDIQAGSSDVTIGWRDSDPSVGVDLEVYFDNITAPGATTAGSQLFLELIDLEGAASGDGVLANNPYVGVSFTMDGATVNIPDDTAGVTAVTTTYSALVTAINSLLDSQGYSTITASLGSSFSAINSDDGNSYQGTTIVLTNSGPEELGIGGWIASGNLPADSNLHTSQSTVAPATSSELTQTDIIFDEVGSGSKGGDFIAGEMSNNAGTSGTAGIQQFNVVVQGDSWLNSITSTNNTLEVINITNDTGFTGDLRIDNVGDFTNEALGDVRVVDASGMEGNVNLTVEVNDSRAKFLDLADTANDGSADNVTFSYMTGSGNDTFNLTFSEETIAHEDALLEIATGGGDDVVTTNFNNYVAGQLDANWLNDQKDLANASIDTGSGDDTVTTTGEGDFIINTQGGNDTVYANNDGVMGATARVNEVQTLTFQAASALGGDITVQGTNVALTGGWTATQVANAVAGALNNTGDFTTADGGSAVAAGGVVTFTFDNTSIDAATATHGNVAAITVDESVGTESTGTLAVTTAGVNAAAASQEVTNVTFGKAGAIAAGAVVTFNGTNVTLADTDGDGDVELDEAATQFAAATFADFTVTDVDFNAGRVQLTAKVAGADLSTLTGVAGANLAVGDFTGSAITGNLSAAAVNFTTAGQLSAGANGANAVSAVAEVQTITTTAANWSGSVEVTVDTDGDGSLTDETEIDVALTAGDTAEQVAIKVQAAVDAALGTNFTVTVTNDVVTITSNASLGNVATATYTDGGVSAATVVAETTAGEIAADANAATWVINAANTERDDLDGQPLSTGTNTLLFGSTVTVTFSGATFEGDSGVTDGVSTAMDNGFESTVTIPTSDYLGDERSINQAIKEAINSDDVLQEFLVAADGADNTLVVTSLVDGRFVVGDLAITVNAATVSNLASSDVTALKTLLADLNNNSAATYTDGALQTALDAAVDNYTTSNALDDLSLATDAGGTEVVAGNASATDSDNTINLGAGNNVVVLGTDANSSDTLVIDGTFGTNSILNFVTTGTGMDMLDFSAYLTNMTSATNSTASQVTIADSFNSVTAAGGDSSVTANEVVIINDFTATATDTWAGLTASELLAAVNSTNTGTANYANIDEGTLDAASAIADLVGGTRQSIVMVENEANDGEYKVFSLTSADTGNTNNDFDSATLLGTLDFGNELTGFSAANVII